MTTKNAYRSSFDADNANKIIIYIHIRYSFLVLATY